MNEVDIRRCYDCKAEKPVSEFHNGARRCKICTKEYMAKRYAANPEKHKENVRRYRARLDVDDPEWRERRWRKNRDRRLRDKYDITLEEWEVIFTEQNKRCAICGSTDPKSPGWPTDHDHVTGQVRGILCSECNGALGLFHDDVEILQAAIEYLSASRLVQASMNGI